MLSPGLKEEFQGLLQRETIARHEFFTSMPIRQQNSLCTHLSIVLFAQHDVVYDAGEEPLGMYFMLLGDLFVKTEMKPRASLARRQSLITTPSMTSAQSI